MVLEAAKGWAGGLATGWVVALARALAAGWVMELALGLASASRLAMASELDEAEPG